MQNAFSIIFILAFAVIICLVLYAGSVNAHFLQACQVLHAHHLTSRGC